MIAWQGFTTVWPPFEGWHTDFHPSQASVRLASKTAAFHLTYHTAAGVAGVLQVVVQKFGGSVLEGFGQSSQQHGELWGVELKQSDQHHLGGLEVVKYKL